MRKTINIGERIIGDNQETFVTFEAGPTHNGLKSALELVNWAAKSSADAIKFQILDPERLVQDKKQIFSYSILKEGSNESLEKKSEPLFDILKRRTLKKEEWVEIKKYADKKNILFFATAAFFDEIDFLCELGCHSIKIASADLNHYPLLEYAAKTGLTIQIDTGMSTIGEIENAIKIINKFKNDKIIIHHCPSGYPARLESIDLNMITTLRNLFKYPIAFSDHSPGLSMDIAAIALGANLIEKTITEDRYYKSVEHIFSLEISETNYFVKRVKEMQTALGKTNRILSKDELNKRKSIRRSIFMKKGSKKGNKISNCQVEFRRPGYGMGPENYDKIKDFFLNKDFDEDKILDWKDIDFK